VAKFAASFWLCWMYRLWWLVTSKPSARSSRFTRSWIGNVFETDRFRLYAPGPVKMLRLVIVAGYGPQSDMPEGTLGSELGLIAAKSGLANGTSTGSLATRRLTVSTGELIEVSSVLRFLGYRFERMGRHAAHWVVPGTL